MLGVRPEDLCLCDPSDAAFSGTAFAVELVGDATLVTVEAEGVHIVAKAGTPTMGGGLILLSIIVATLLWADLTNGYVWVVLGVTAGFGLVGFADDYRKVTLSSHAGVPGRVRLAIEFVIAFIAVWAVMALSSDSLRDRKSVV